MAAPAKVESFSEELKRWLDGDAEKTLGSLVDVFGRRGFAALFVVLLAVPALPLPTGGATHVFEAVAILLALQLVVDRDRLWLPQRWRRVEIAGPRQRRLLHTLVRIVRRLERSSHPRAAIVFGHRLSNVVFGALVIAGSLAAFIAPPFSLLDTLPSLGVVLLSLGVLLEDVALASLGIVVGTLGVVLEIVLWGVAVRALRDLL